MAVVRAIARGCGTLRAAALIVIFEDVAVKLQDVVLSRWTDVGVLVAGAALPFAFAPYNLTGLALIAPAVLFASWFAVTPRRAWWRGLLFGVGMFCVGISWVHISIHGYGGVPLSLSIPLTVLLVLYMALYPAAVGWLVVRLFPGVSLYAARIKLLWVMPAAWVGGEWLRGWMFTGFPWLNLGYSQIDGPLRGYAPWLGVYGVSWAVAATGGLLVLLLFARQLRYRLAYMVLLGGMWGVGALLTGMLWTAPAGDPLKVSLLQGNVSQDLKWLAELRQPTIDLYMDLTRKNWDSALVVWPESALPDFFHREQSALEALAAEGREHDTDLLIGLLYLDRQTNQYYNSVVSLGAQTDFYHKRHLVPFTEYLPLKRFLGGVVDFMQVPMSDFSSGDPHKHTVLAAAHDIGVSICFEDAFGEEAIKALPDATLLVNVSNDAWFGTSAAPHQHLQMARMRALETGRPLLRATNTGVSAIVDYDGSLIATAPQFEVAVVKGFVQPRGGSTPYGLAGNALVLDALGAVLLLGALAVRRDDVPRDDALTASNS
jgi:apolipoprotein N-acyltransferase